MYFKVPYMKFKWLVTYYRYVENPLLALQYKVFQCGSSSTPVGDNQLSVNGWDHKKWCNPHVSKCVWVYMWECVCVVLSLFPLLWPESRERREEKTASLTLKLTLIKCHFYLPVIPAYWTPTLAHRTGDMLSHSGSYSLINLQSQGVFFLDGPRLA